MMDTLYIQLILFFPPMVIIMRSARLKMTIPGSQELMPNDQKRAELFLHWASLEIGFGFL
jgi:hypothetical protein